MMIDHIQSPIGSHHSIWRCTYVHPILLLLFHAFALRHALPYTLLHTIYHLRVSVESCTSQSEHHHAVSLHRTHL